MRFRTLTLVGILALGLLAEPLTADAQEPGKAYRIGWLGASTFHNSTLFGPFLRAMRALGWDSQDFFIEHRWASGDSTRFPDFAAELVHLEPDVIVTVSAQATRAAMSATETTPIVFTMVADPVGAGFVASLSRPGSNATGVTNVSRELRAKQLELLKQVVPGLTRVAVLWNSAAPDMPGEWRAMQAAASASGVELEALEVRGPDDLEPALNAAPRKGAGALIVLWDPLTYIYAKKITDLATKNRLPAMYLDERFVGLGNAGFISYGPDAVELAKLAAAQVDKILKGGNPADLAVEQNAKFELIIDLRTARALGLSVPRSLLLQANRVIE